MGERNALAPTWLDLYEYRRRMARLYAEREAALRRGEEDEAVWQRFRAAKDALYARHPQSPLDAEQRVAFAGLRYFPYNAALRLEADLAVERTDDGGTGGEGTAGAGVEGGTQELPSSGPRPMRFPRAGRVRFALDGVALELVVYWIDVYGGGLFLPFRDTTCPRESYGGGRYLFDTVKGS
ncbi:MAG: DUF1684 domain-containing protein, partial [Ktedonobacterales bacterium]|nr:DUF1684 domain-containing protein [Ktedonobacterales bacterium]